MSVGTPPLRAVREGSAEKRSAILGAARDLFVRNGVERTSMDAVAALAGVSKRTVYDYYGDKHGLLLGVIEGAGEAHLSALKAAIATHLDGEPQNLVDLEHALAAFAVQLGATMFESPDYAAAVKLVAHNEDLLPELKDHPLDIAPEEAIAERLAHFAALGLLDVDEPRLAADHFNALTALLAINSRALSRDDPERIRQIMTDGTHAFIRAYGRREPTQAGIGRS